uniref:Xaa-Pro dipeptidase n=1 Tax=Globodera pallida TaxID=36090 RepID=A0A183BPU8_GLOPA
MSFCRGPNTFSVPAQLFCENRIRLVTALRQKLGGAAAGACVLLEGGKECQRYNTDANDSPFRQESYFFWAFGVHEEDCYAAIDVASGKSAIFPPKLSPDYAIWLGKILPEKWFQDKYQVDHVHFQTGGAEIGEKADNTDSGNVLEPANLPGLDSFSTDVGTLYPVMAELRVIKTDFELAVLRYASAIANKAHKEVMRRVRPEMFEYQLESLFRHISYSTGGCRHLGYTCIAATGQNAAILHYGHCNAPNDKLIKDGDICLFDMGPEYNCYTSDVTCSFPANGKFKENQKVIYNAVLRANRTVLSAAKPVILEDLKSAGILRGDVAEMVDKRLGAVFMPHGLGHFMGLDVHDVGGYLGDALPRSDKPGLKSLRTTRTLKERMCITIEPGCYFIDTVLDKALADPELSQYFNVDRLREFRGVGGVRIEDDVIIWEKENENMNADVPRTVEEIEHFMANAKDL